MKSARWLILAFVFVVIASIYGFTSSSNRLTHPSIVVSTSFAYKGSWWGDYYELEGRQLTLPGDGNFALELHFEHPLDPVTLEGRFLMNGTELSIESATAEGRVFMKETEQDSADVRIWDSMVRLHLPEALTNQSYVFTLRKGIRDTAGKVLARDFSFTVNIDSPTYASFTLLGSENVYPHLGSRSPQRNLLTPYPKTFRVDFTEDVDRLSVETTIRQQLDATNGATASFDWINDHSLKLYIEDLTPGASYALLLSQASDSRGHKITGDLYFQVGEPTSLKVVHLASGHSELSRELPDRLYGPVASDRIGDYLILDDQHISRIFCIETQSMVAEYALGRLPYRPLQGKPIWYNPQTFLYIDPPMFMVVGKIDSPSSGPNLNKYCLASQVSTPLFPVNTAFTRTSVVSPGGSKIAIAAVSGSDRLLDIHVYDFDGNLLLSEQRGRINLAHDVFLAWLDDDTIVFEEWNGGDVNLYSLQLNSGELRELSFRSIGIAASRNGAVIFQRLEGRKYHLLTNGKEIELHIGTPPPTNIYVATEETIVYNQQGKVVIYDVRNGKSLIVEEGFLIGVSADGERAYYLTNYPHSGV